MKIANSDVIVADAYCRRPQRIFRNLIMMSVFVLGTAIFPFCAISTIAATKPVSGIAVSIPINPWMDNYIKSEDKALEGHQFLHARIPMVWLFNPKGQAIAWAGNVEELEKVLKNFPSRLLGRTPMTQHPIDLATQLKLLRKSSGTKLPMPPQGYWTALLYERKNHCEKVCLVFSRQLQSISDHAGSKLFLVTITLNLKSGSPRN